MRFHLTYEGRLYGSSTKSPRARHKHEIRKVFHRQLKRLWETTWLSTATYGKWDSEQTLDPMTPLRDGLALDYQRGQYRYVPLVYERVSLLCSLDILFLRPQRPGELIQAADIDNRLKTLFDALRMPNSAVELGEYQAPDAEEDPFFCLLEDDRLISHVSVTTDSLLEPISGEDSDARLVIDVKVSPYRVTMGNLSYGGG